MTWSETLGVSRSRLAKLVAARSLMVVTRRISWRHVERQGTKQSRVDSIRGFFDNQAPSHKARGLPIYWLTSLRSRNKSVACHMAIRHRYRLPRRALAKQAKSPGMLSLENPAIIRKLSLDPRQRSKGHVLEGKRRNGGSRIISTATIGCAGEPESGGGPKRLGEGE